MSIYAVEYLEQGDLVGEDFIKMNEYIRFVERNLKSNDLLRNPFSGSIKHFPKENMIVVNMRPLYPNPWVFALLCIIPIMIFNGLAFTWWYLIPFFILCGSIPHIGWFQYKMFCKGARKRGFKGTIKKISLADALERLV